LGWKDSGEDCGDYCEESVFCFGGDKVRDFLDITLTYLLKMGLVVSLKQCECRKGY